MVAAVTDQATFVHASVTAEDVYKRQEVTDAPYPVISYKQAMLEFGTDKPDLRNPLRIVDVTDFFQDVYKRQATGRLCE